MQVVQWPPANWTTSDLEYSSPDIRNLIQNIVDQGAWANGHDLVLIMRGSGLREPWSYDGDPLKGAELTITYDSACFEQGILYVNVNASGVQDGSSWTNAFRSLPQALDKADHCSGISQIWIAGGTYAPFYEVSRIDGFVIRGGLSVYGGFAGTETNINQRIVGTNTSILSGDIGVANNQSDNLYHVVTVSGGVGSVLLDGLTIQKGLANGLTFSLQNGSGIYNQGILTCNQVILINNSFPSFYNAPGSLLTSGGSLQIKP
jgi:hypothetical protein